ncbi:hypothetical protein ACB098_07G136900 [Castanea mollissima]
MAEAVVSGVVTRIGDLLVQEGKFLSGVSNHVEMLQTELNLMQGLLKDADARQDESETVRRWVAEIRDLAYDADDIIATYALTVGSRKGGGVQKVLKRCSCIFDEGITVHQVGSKIEDIKEKISSLKTSFEGYGIKESIIQEGGSSSSNEKGREERETFSHLEDDLVGFDDILKKLVEFLLKEEKGKEVASICGMGGLGKTTLAKMVYNDTRVKQHFDCFAWVCITQQCQKRPVWEEILISLPSKYQRDKIKELSNADLVNELRQVQQTQKCLVVLDDIWEIEDWRILYEAFPVNDTRSKILLTSRKNDVASHANPRGVHKLECLNHADSLELLEKKAISWRSDSETKTYMKRLGKEMIEYCGGLPLAITVLGGLLATKQTREEWEDVHKHVKSYLHEQQNFQVNKVLALSYNDLPFHLKPCFLYLGHFPEDFEILTKELIRMWMGEGFISQNQDRGGRKDTMDDVGDRYLRELVQRCMVLVGKEGSFGRIKTCRMHDVMRDFCVSKAQDESFLHITNTLSMKQRETQIGKVRRLAIISKSSDNCIEGIKFNEYPYLRSLLHLFPGDQESYFKESRFKKFKLVRVLHLEYFKNHLRKLPKDTGCLIHLRYLSLKGSKINEVPSFIGNLSCLETLDLRIDFRPLYCILGNYIYRNTSLLDSISYPRVPNVFKYMKQLKHLYLPREYRVRGKLELANLSYLQTLVNVEPKTIQIPTWFEFNRLRVLKVGKNTQDAMQMLISKCPLVEKLTLFYPIEKLPEAHQFPPNLAKLTLGRTLLEEDPMPTLEKLPNLKILCLGGDCFIGKDMVCSEGGFPLLQNLHLCGLEEWTVKEGAMPSLCHLIIGNSRRLMAIPDGLRFVTTLRELEIRNMPKPFKDRLDEGGLDFDKVKHVPSLVFQNCDWEWESR